MLKIDFRTSASRRTASGKSGRGLSGVLRMVLLYLIFSIVFAPGMAMAVNPYPLVIMFEMMLGLLVASNIMMEFQSIILSAAEIEIIQCQPVASPTYFFARLANLITYTTVIAGSISFLPSLALALSQGRPAYLGPVFFAASVINAVSMSLLMSVVYSVMLRFISPGKLQRVAGYVQVIVSLTVYGGAFIMSSFINKQLDALIGGTDVNSWIQLIPSSWYASWLLVANGGLHGTHALLAAMSLILPVVLALLSIRYLSISYIERLSKTRTESKGKAGKEHSYVRTKKYENRAVLMLMLRHIKHDSRCRLSLLSVLPLTLVYILPQLTGSSTISDPFISSDDWAVGRDMIVFGIVFVPLMVKRVLTRSEWYTAAWIYEATPCDKTQIVLTIRKLLVRLVFIPYMAIVLVIYACFYSSLIHAFLHVLFQGLMAFVLLQMAYVKDPSLPFSESGRDTQGSRTMVISIILIPMIAVIVGPLAVRFIYPDPVRFAGGIASLLVISLMMDIFLRKKLKHINA
jgi:hypothetical protein